MRAQAIHLNTLIKQNNPETIKLDENHIPHITLLQGFINEKNLPIVKDALNVLFKTIESDTMQAESIFYYKDKEESFAMIVVEKSDQLLKLHEKTIEIVKPFIVKNGSEASFVPNPDGSPISESTIKYVPEFVEKYSYENFDPHISLGVAQKVLLDSLTENVFNQIQFQPTSVSVYQLGDHGTTRKLLWKSD
ncbi:MAG: hypothetical protein JJE55_01480 [Flavobacteriaceae bacterium]|nr:hypothetical protein [Flavobacteriaceae bacterium]